MKESSVFTLYTLFKFLHVLAAMIWIGGLSTLTILNAANF